MTLSVVQFPGGNLADIPGVLRRLADEIERGDFGELQSLVWITLDDDGVTKVGALGHNVDKYRAAGIAQAAMNKLTGEG